MTRALIYIALYAAFLALLNMAPASWGYAAGVWTRALRPGAGSQESGLRGDGGIRTLGCPEN